jgi:hypothetical protein
MVKEPKGYWNSSGEKVERETPLSTKTGIVLYKGKGDKWIISYPDMYQYGNVTTIKLIDLIYHLGRGRNLDDSRRLAKLLVPDDL